MIKVKIRCNFNLFSYYFTITNFKKYINSSGILLFSKNYNQLYLLFFK